MDVCKNDDDFCITVESKNRKTDVICIKWCRDQFDVYSMVPFNYPKENMPDVEHIWMEIWLDSRLQTYWLVNRLRCYCRSCRHSPLRIMVQARNTEDYIIYTYIHIYIYIHGFVNLHFIVIDLNLYACNIVHHSPVDFWLVLRTIRSSTFLGSRDHAILELTKKREVSRRRNSSHKRDASARFSTTFK